MKKPRGTSQFKKEYFQVDNIVCGTFSQIQRAAILHIPQLFEKFFNVSREHIF